MKTLVLIIFFASAVSVSAQDSTSYFKFLLKGEIASAPKNIPSQGNGYVDIQVSLTKNIGLSGFYLEQGFPIDRRAVGGGIFAQYENYKLSVGAGQSASKIGPYEGQFVLYGKIWSKFGKIQSVTTIIASDANDENIQYLRHSTVYQIVDKLFVGVDISKDLNQEWGIGPETGYIMLINNKKDIQLTFTGGYMIHKSFNSINGSIAIRFEM